MSGDYQQEFTVTVDSPHGKQAVESFEHFLRKVSSEARDRWGISIEIERVADEPEHEVDFE